MKQHPQYLLPAGGEERPDLSSASGQVKRLVGSKISQTGRTRPTNNQLLYRATFHWDHYRKALTEGPKLPDSTEACASVTSAFLQVVAILFDVEKRREIQPRNVLRSLATNTRRTKVVELSSGTHRVPEELKRHSIQDGEGGHYSTNLDRNRYGSDDQYLATVVRYNLDYLDLCPCLVSITILDAKGGNETTTVSVDPCACICNAGASRIPGPSDARSQRVIRTTAPGGAAAVAPLGLPEEAEAASRQPDGETTSGRDRFSPLQGAVAMAPNSARSQMEGGPAWPKTDRLQALLDVTDGQQDPNRKALKTPSMQFQRPRRSGEGDSFDGSEAHLDRSAAANEPLRRSSRKAAKRFVRSMDDAEWEQSDDDNSSYSGDSDSRTNRRVSDRWQNSNRMRRRKSGGSLAQGKGAWQPDGRSRKRDRESLEEENWQLRQELELCRKREQMAFQQCNIMQQEIQNLQAALVMQLPAKDNLANLSTDALRRLPNGNLGNPLPLPGIMGDPNNKEADAQVAKMVAERSMAERSMLCALAQVGLPYTPAPDLGANRSGDSALQLAAQNAAAAATSNAQLQAVMRGSSAFSIPYPQPGMLGFPQFPMTQRPQGFDYMQATPNAAPKPSNGEAQAKPTSATNTPAIATPARPGTLLKPLAMGLNNPVGNPEERESIEGTPERAEVGDKSDAVHLQQPPSGESNVEHENGQDSLAQKAQKEVQGLS